MTHLQNWTMAALFAAMLLVASALLEGPDDLQAEADTAAALADAREQALREHVARQRCADMHGPNAAHLWDVAGSLHCLRPKGPLVTAGL